MINHELIKVSYGQTYKNKDGEFTGIRNGAPLAIRTLKEMLDYQATLTHGEKKSFGGIYPFEDTIKREKSSVDSTYKSGHVMFFDIDGLMSDDIKKKVFNSFNELKMMIPCLYAMCFSNSGNIHAFMYTQERYNTEEYWLMESALLCMLGKAIEDVCGITLYPGSTTKDDQKNIEKSYLMPYEEITHNLDMHNTNMFQQIYLAASPWPELGYMLNEDCMPVILTEDQIKAAYRYYHYESLVRKYDNYYHPKSEDGIDRKVKSTGYLIGELNTPKIKVKGEINHDARWQIRNMLAASYGYEKGDKIFMQLLESYDQYRVETGMERKRNVTTMFKVADGGKRQLRLDAGGRVKCSKEVRDILTELGFTFTSTSPEDSYLDNVSDKVAPNVLGKNEFLLDRKDYIMEQLKEHQVNIIKAPTGSGKTEFVKAISQEGLTFIAAPYNSMLGIYGSKQPGSPVDAVENELHKRGKDDSIEKWLEKGGSAVAVWDQASRFFDRLYNNGYHLIVDESHTLCPGTSYRPRAIEFNIGLDQFIRRGGKVTFVTATPTVEEMEFPYVNINRINMEKVTRRRKVDICYNILNKSKDKFNEGSADWRIVGDVVRNYRMNAFDYVLVLSDRYNNIICERLLAKGIEAKQLNNSLAETDLDVKKNIDDLSKNCMMEKGGVYVATNYLENGFNINNIEGSALILMDVKRGKCGYQKIVQIIGRFRKLPNVYTKVYMEGVVGEREDGQNITIRKSQEVDSYIKQVKSMEVAKSGLDIDFDEDMMIGKEEYVLDGRRYTRKAYEEQIDRRYSSVHGTPEQLKVDLEECGMIVELKDMINEDKENVFISSTRKMKKEMEKVAWEMMMGRVDWDDDFMAMRYPVELNVMYKRLCKSYNEDVVVMFADKLLEATPENNRSTILKKLEDCLPWSIHDDAWCEDQKRKADVLIARLKVIAKDVKIGDMNIVLGGIRSAIDERVEWREKYGEWKNESDVVRISSVMDDDIVLAMDVRTVAHSKPHKPHKSHKKAMYRCDDGFEGTKDDVMEHLQVGKTVFHKKVALGLIEKL